MKYSLLLIATFLCISIYGQPIFIKQLSYPPHDTVIKDNILYMSHNQLRVIETLDLTNPSSDIVTLIEEPEIWRVTAMAFKGDTLYVTEEAGGRIVKLNTADPNPSETVELVWRGLLYSSPTYIAFHGETLYIANGWETSIVSRLDTSKPPIATIEEKFVEPLGSNPLALAVRENELYIADYDGNKISKVDLTAAEPVVTDVVTGLNTPIDLAFVGNDLYIAEVDGNKISKVDVTATSPVATEVLRHDTGIFTLETDGENLYFTADFESMTGRSKLYKFQVLLPCSCE